MWIDHIIWVRRGKTLGSSFFWYLSYYNQHRRVPKCLTLPHYCYAGTDGTGRRLITPPPLLRTAGTGGCLNASTTAVQLPLFSRSPPIAIFYPAVTTQAQTNSCVENSTYLHGSQPDPRVGSGGFQTFAGQVGSGQQVFEISQVRVGFGHEVFKSDVQPVGSGLPDPTIPAKKNPDP